MKKIILLILMCSLLFAGCTRKNPEYTVPDNIEQESTVPSETVEGITLEEETDFDTDENAMLEWDERCAVIPEVGREYEIWFLADSHIIISDETDTEEVRTYAAQRSQLFTNEKGIMTSWILTEFIELANEQRPDMVLFGGDILDFPSEANVAFLKEELSKLTVPYVYVMGNHDWTFPWEYMTPEGKAQYRPLYEEILYGNFAQETAAEEEMTPDVINIKSNSYSSVVELEDLVILAVDDSSNQVAAEAVENIEYAYTLGKPILLLQHVPFSTEKLIAEAKKYWASPVTLGMQVHGGLAPNDVSADLYSKVRDDESAIRVVLAGHVHFPYEEKISEHTVEIITDAAFKGKFVKLRIISAQ